MLHHRPITGPGLAAWAAVYQHQCRNLVFRAGSLWFVKNGGDFQAVKAGIADDFTCHQVSRINVGIKCLCQLLGLIFPEIHDEDIGGRVVGIDHQGEVRFVG